MSSHEDEIALPQDTKNTLDELISSEGDEPEAVRHERGRLAWVLALAAIWGAYEYWPKPKIQQPTPEQSQQDTRTTRNSADRAR